MKTNQNETLATSGNPGPLDRQRFQTEASTPALLWERMIVAFSLALLFFFASTGRAETVVPVEKDSVVKSSAEKDFPKDAQVVETKTKAGLHGRLNRVRHLVIDKNLVRVEDQVSPEGAFEPQVFDYSRFRVHMKAESSGFASLLSMATSAGARVSPTDSPEVFMVTYNAKSLSRQESLRQKIKKALGVERVESLL